MKLAMKYIFSIFLAALLLLAFSCAGTPEKEDGQIEQEQSAETPNSQEGQEEGLIEGYAELPEESSQVQAAGIPADDNKEELSKVETPGEIEIPSAEIAGTEPPPPVQPPETPPAQETLPPPPPAQEPPAREAPAVQARPQQPPPPRETPPLPPPALLGPAEEITKERETFIPLREPEIEPPARVNIPSPPAAAPQEGGEIVFSRIVRATVGQLIEIPFRGTGWIYLGELASRRGIIYDSRRLDPEGQSFIFRAEEAGTYALKFVRQDFIRDYILNDHVQVIVGEAPSTGAGWFNPPYDRGRVTAQPRWPSAIDEAEIRSGSRPSVNTPPEVSPGAAFGPRETVPAQMPSAQAPAAPVQETTPAQPPSAGAISETRESIPPEPQPSRSQNGEGSPPETILQRAKEAFDGGNAAAAIALLDQYAQIFPGGTDELYWYYGQFYEANTPSRNILLSLDYYRRLVNEFPQSSRLNDARRRIAYLERFYINIQ